MKAIIECSTPEQDWPSKFFGNMNAYMLPILGKPLIEYYLDWCSLSGIKEVLVLSEDYDEDFESFISNGSRWGLNITKSTLSVNDTKDDVLMKNSKFSGGGIVFMNGFFFPYYDKNAQKTELHPCFEGRIFMSGSMCTGVNLCAYNAVELDSLKKYFFLNMSLLKEGTNKVITKGYGAEEGVFMGMNVIVTKDAELYPPFVIGDNVQIEVDSRIGPGTVIGDTCIVDCRTKIEDSLIFDKTYVGADLDIRQKILNGNMIIDPETGETMTFADNFFTAKMSQGTVNSAIRRAVEIPLSLIMLVSLLPAYLLFMVIGTPKYRMASLAGSEGRIKYKIFSRDKSWKNAWFFKLSQDKLNLLKLVLLGKIRLIGDTMRADDVAPDIIKRYKQYDPGAFSYADSLGHADPYETLIDDLFYKHGRSIKNNFQILLRTFIGRLLRGS